MKALFGNPADDEWKYRYWLKTASEVAASGNRLSNINKENRIYDKNKKEKHFSLVYYCVFI